MDLSDEEFLERLKIIRQADRDVEDRIAKAEAKLAEAEAVGAVLRNQLLDAGITPDV